MSGDENRSPAATRFTPMLSSFAMGTWVVELVVRNESGRLSSPAVPLGQHPWERPKSRPGPEQADGNYRNCGMPPVTLPEHRASRRPTVCD